MQRSLAPVVSLILASACASTASAPSSAVRIPVTLINNRIHLPVSVKGQPPANFILDTGAGRSPLDAEYAKKIGVTGALRGQAVGAAGVIDIDVALNVPMRVGPIDIDVDYTALIPFGPVSLRAGTPIDGVLGSDIFNKYVAEIDYTRREVAFHDPAAYQPPANAAMLPVELRNGTPYVDVQVTLADGRTAKAKMLIDTGAGMAIVLNRHFAQKHDVDLSQAPEVSVTFGVGGGGKERVARIASLQLGPFAFEKPVALFSQDKIGAVADEEVDGIIGAEILRRFTVTADYPHKRFFLVPNGDLKDPLEFDMSGAVLAIRDAKFDAIVVSSVLPSSPAAEAGLRSGDQLKAVNGRAVTPARLEEIRNLFREPQRRYKLTLVRDGAEQQVTITTRRML